MNGGDLGLLIHGCMPQHPHVDWNFVFQSVQRFDESWSRKCFPLHLTASVLVCDEAMQKTLLVRHATLDKLLQPGGHIESGESPLYAALRDFGEECNGSFSSILTLDSEPFDVDLHEIPASQSKGEPAHWHLDLCYLVRVPASFAADESLGTEWVALHPNVASPGTRLHRLTAKALERRSVAIT
jgi:ADP-ribose pyrophosphatase YjhB (NUDIX family)